MTNYPECEKMQAVKEQSQELGFFLEWLKNRFTLAEMNYNFRAIITDTDDNEESVSGILFPSYKSINQILAEYFEIDLEKVDEEKRQILEEIRSKK